MNHLSDEFFEFEGLLRRYHGWKRRMQGPMSNPYRGQGRILAMLKIQPEISQKELGYLLDMRPQSLGELLGKLEKRELITREASQEDRRKMIIKLTEAGKEEAEKAEAEIEDSIFDELNEDEQRQLQAILAKLSAAIREKVPEDIDFSRGFDPDERREMMARFMEGKEFGGRKGFGPGEGFGGGPGRGRHMHFF